MCWVEDRLKAAIISVLYCGNGGVSSEPTFRNRQMSDKAGRDELPVAWVLAHLASATQHQYTHFRVVQ